MRVRFNEVFNVNLDGSISAKMPVIVGGVPVQPGVEFGRRVRLGNLHFAAVAGRDLEIEHHAGQLHVLRPYNAPPDGQPSPAPMASAMTREPMPLGAAP